MNLRDLRLRVRALLAPRRVERDLDDELAFHLEREAQKLIAAGMTATEARAKARARFGSIPAAADACRDARGTAVVDGTVRDVRYALRSLRRAPLVASTIVATVGLGLGLVAVAFTLLNALLFRVDHVPNVDEMFTVEGPRTRDGEPLSFTRAQLDALRRETDVFTDAYGELSGIDVRVEGRSLLSTFVTGNFFKVVGVDAALGRTLGPADDEPFAGRPVIVLSDRGWERLFARDPAVLGRALLVNGASLEIVGVMPRDFRGLSVIPPDYWIPLAMVGHVRRSDRGNEAAVGVRIVGRVKPGLSRQTASARLAVWAAGQSNGSRRPDRGTSGVTLVPWRGIVEQSLDAMLVMAPLFFAFGLILLIGCANVANLLLARAVVRQREIGVRLSLGAGRGRIVRELMTESLLLALLAAAAGFAFSRAALRAIMTAMMASWPPEIGNLQLMVPDADWRVLMFLAAGAVVSAVLFGLIPALRATHIEPIRTMRGEVIGESRPGRTRSLLIGMQVSASALLLICSAVFLRSAFTAATADPGMRASEIVMVGIANERSRQAIVQAVAAEPSVAAVAALWPPVMAAPRGAIAESDGAKASVAYKFVSPEYFSVLDIGVLRGRAFAPDERHPSLPVAVVSETAARALWPAADAVGQVMRLDLAPGEATRADEPPLGSRMVTIVGVVRDVAGFRIAPLPKAVVYVPTNATMPRTALVARVRGDAEAARQVLLERLTAIEPDMDQVGIMGWVTRLETYFLQLGFWATVALGGLALALTLSGLFSTLSYLVAQRTKEIGVRMALGASARDVTRLVLSQSIRPVGGGLVLGGAAAAGLSAVLLATPAAATIGQIVRVRDPIAYGVSALIITAACLAAAAIPAARAARLDPTRTLRQE